MTIESGRPEELTYKDQALAFYGSWASAYSLLWVQPQSAQEVVDGVTKLIKRYKSEAVETAKYYCRTLVQKELITQSEAYFIMYQVCDRYALSVTMTTNAWEYNPQTIDKYEALAKGFLTLASESVE